MNVPGMHTETALGTVRVIVLECGDYCPKGQFFPGNGVFGEQRHLQAFHARSEIEVKQARPIKDVNLIDVGDG